MPAQDPKPLQVALICPAERAPLALHRGASALARWIARDLRMDLVRIEQGGVAPDRSLAARLTEAEMRFRPGPTPVAMPDAGGKEGADVVVDLSGCAPQPTDPPRFGTWRLSAFDPGAGFLATATGSATTPVVLTCTQASGRHVIARARYSPKPLAGLNAAFIAEKSVQLVQRALADVHLNGQLPQTVPDTVDDREPSATVGRYLTGLAPKVGRRIGQRVAKWSGRQPGVFALRLCEGDPLSFDPAEGRTLRAPKGRFWADPFVQRHADVDYVFYEEFLESRQRGILKVARLEDDHIVPLGEPVVRDHHLSFPYVFEGDGAIWMIPETSRGGRLEMLRAVDFPLRWEHVATAFEGQAPADTVLSKVDGCWWLFTHFPTDRFRDYCSELHIFRVDGPLLREIEPHPLNPVVIDSRTARAGGRVWSQGGRLYRASQDNAYGVYGWGLNIMEITRLDMTGYAERQVRHIAPGFAPGVIGCHHMDFSGGRVVMDVRYRSASAMPS